MGRFFAGIGWGYSTFACTEEFLQIWNSVAIHHPSRRPTPQWRSETLGPSTEWTRIWWMSSAVSFTFGKSLPNRLKLEWPHVLVASLVLFWKTRTFKTVHEPIFCLYTNTYNTVIWFPAFSLHLRHLQFT